MNQKFGAMGALMAAFGVALGAAGAHALKAHLSLQQLETFRTGAHYLLFHGVATCCLGLASQSPRLVWPVRLMMLGSIIFCLSVCLVSATPLKIFGAIAPIGGALMISGWLLLALEIWRQSKEAKP